MAIAKHKHRYNVTLTRDVVNKFQGLCSDLGLPPSIMSESFDGFLLGMIELLQVWKEEGKVDVNSLKQLMGKNVELLDDIEKESRDVQEQKRNTVCN